MDVFQGTTQAGQNKRAYFTTLQFHEMFSDHVLGASGSCL
jgi:hypothetical protein